ncbi:MAG: (d)CMP kinase, partial [Lutimaribacter sp.]
ATRRHLELAAGGSSTDNARVLAVVKERDARDMNRADAPLHPASDAHILDTSQLSIAQAIAQAIAAITSKQKG